MNFSFIDMEKFWEKYLQKPLKSPKKNVPMEEYKYEDYLKDREKEKHRVYNFDKISEEV